MAPWLDCVCSQLKSRLSTDAFFLMTRMIGYGLLKVNPAVFAARLVKSPCSVLVV